MFTVRNMFVALNRVRTFTISCKKFSEERLIVPSSEKEGNVFSQKIEKLVTDISRLTILEVSELSTALKERLNLPDTPVLPTGGFATVNPIEEEEETAPKSVQTSFTVKLMKYDETQKIALIKECKSLLEGLNLVQAKKFVESCPAVVKADVSKEEAEKLKEALSKVGAEIIIE